MYDNESPHRRLKKRHSAYSLPSDHHPSTTTTHPPLPPRNPARAAPAPPPPPFIARKLKNPRPSTADSALAPSIMAPSVLSHASSIASRERLHVTPWEFQSLQETSERELPVPTEPPPDLVRLPANERRPPQATTAPTTTAAGTGTGTVEDVTPWEMYSVPVPGAAPADLRTPAATAGGGGAGVEGARSGLGPGAGLGLGTGARIYPPSTTASSRARSGTDASTSSSKNSASAVSLATSSSSASGSGSGHTNASGGFPTPTPYSLGFLGISKVLHRRDREKEKEREREASAMHEQEQDPQGYGYGHQGRGSTMFRPRANSYSNAHPHGYGAYRPDAVDLNLDTLNPGLDPRPTISASASTSSFPHHPPKATSGSSTPTGTTTRPSTATSVSTSIAREEQQHAGGDATTPTSASSTPLSPFSSRSISADSSFSSASAASASSSSLPAPALLQLHAALGSGSSHSNSGVVAKGVGGPGGGGPGLAVSTGSVEDVVPWELLPGPPTPSQPVQAIAGSVDDRSSVSARSDKERKNLEKERRKEEKKQEREEKERKRKSASRKSLVGSVSVVGTGPGSTSSVNVSASVHSGVNGSGGGVQRTTATATGPKEEVTPWELEDALPAPPVPAVPPVPPLPSAAMGVGVAGAIGDATITPATRARMVSSSAAGSASGSASAGGEVDQGQWQTQIQTHGPSPVQAPSSNTNSVTSSPELSARKKSGAGGRGSMTLEQMEEVMPWELYPVGGENGGGEGESEKEKEKMSASMPHQHHQYSAQQQQQQPAGRQSTAASAFSELGLRKRRSTGGGTKSRSGKEKDKDRDVGIASSSSAGSAGGPSTTTTKEAKERSRLSGLGISSASVAYSTSTGSGYSAGAENISLHTPTSPVASSSSASITHFGSAPGAGSSSSHVNAIGSGGPTSASSSAPHTHSHAATADPRFSTADRTILEQLKQGIKARAQQFAVKGVGHSVYGGGLSAGKRYHPFTRQEVPYPRSYDREVVDLDVWETMFTMGLCQSLTWHVFETPPAKVLEIGCGTGTWILHCARTWKDCHFVGLDVVPLHPDLQNVGSPDLASRITWVQHNFLDVLPFQNEEFDFVHIKRIALGVPEDKWDPLFEEIQRVMKPGAAFEMVEEDLFFPGKPVDDDDISVASLHADDESSITRRDSVSSDEHRTVNGLDATDKLARVSESDSPVTPTSAAFVVPSSHLPSRPPSPTQNRENGANGAQQVDEPSPPPPQQQQHSHPAVPSSASTSSHSTEGVHLVTPHSRSLVRPALSVKTQRNTGTSGNTSVDAAAAAPPAYYGSTLGGMGYVASQDPAVEFIKDQRRAAAQVARKQAIESSPPVKNKPGTLVTSTITPPPANPRDHTMLEAIWNGMLESRFVNITPLSLLTTYLEYHFKDVRTHPPLLYTFPPLPDKPDPEDEDEQAAATPHHLPSDSETDMDDARVTAMALPSKPRSTKSAKSRKSVGSNSTAHGEEHAELDLQGLLKRQSPYVTLDGSRSYAFSPAMRATFTPAKEGRSPPVRRMSRLPNPTLNIDLRTLHLHLTVRAKEIIACSESMWEWVVERQAAAAKEAAQGGRFRSGSASIEEYMVGVHGSASSSSLNLAQSAILEMTRDDFDHLMKNFEMDMNDKASVGHALEERFDWHVFTSPVLQDRKAFDSACEKYDKYIAAKTQSSTNPYRQSNTHRSRNSMSTPGLVQPTSNLLFSNDHNMISRSTSTPQPSSAERPADDTSSIVTATNAPETRHDTNSSHTHLVSPSVSQLSTHSQTGPAQMLSRAMRVFVAWKAS